MKKSTALTVMITASLILAGCGTATDAIPADTAPTDSVSVYVTDTAEVTTEMQTETTTKITTEPEVTTEEVTEAPVTEAPVPVTEAPVPVTEAPAPVTEAPAPVTEAPQADVPAVGTSSAGMKIETVGGVTYVGGILVANKTYSLPSTYNPGGLTAECTAAFGELQRGASAAGYSIWCKSGFRSYWDQNYIYNDYAARDGQALADTYSARPGHSEHQTGLALDVNSLYTAFGDTAEGKWLAAHAWEYGFVIRYPADKVNITGYMYEPWHIRYVGKYAAEQMQKRGLCLEEYLGVDSAYR